MHKKLFYMMIISSNIIVLITQSITQIHLFTCKGVHQFPNLFILIWPDLTYFQVKPYDVSTIALGYQCSLQLKKRQELEQKIFREINKKKMVLLISTNFVTWGHTHLRGIHSFSFRRVVVRNTSGELSFCYFSSPGDTRV